MNRFLIAFTVLAFAVPTIAPTVTVGGDLLSPTAADRLGLVEAWHRQMGTIGGADSIIDMQVWVQRNKEHEYIEVVRTNSGPAGGDGEVLRRIATDQKNAYGVDIGAKEADRLARMDVLKLTRRGIEATIRSNKIKQVRLYMLGSDGGMWAYDAETGEVIWHVRVGNPRFGYGTIGVSDTHVTVINGTTMYRIIADERQLENSVAPGGRPMQPVRLDHIPVIGATNTPNFAVIPNTRKGLESFTFDEQPGEPYQEIFAGQALAKPTRFPTSSMIGWSTEGGFFYVMETEGTPSALFRLHIDGNAYGGVTPASGDRFFMGSSAGRVYGVRATRSGEVLWNRSFGEPFYQAPYVTEEHVLIASRYGNLYCLTAADGLPEWASPATNIDTIFAHAGDYYFGRTTAGLLTILRPDSGQMVSTGGSVFIDRVVFNPETDRIYLISGGGTVQCLRPADAELPTFYRDLAEPTKKVDEKGATTLPANGNANPFGAEKPADAPDPFGGPDPFGSPDPASDPFGGGAATDDPFGGADPFGN